MEWKEFKFRSILIISVFLFLVNGAPAPMSQSTTTNINDETQTSSNMTMEKTTQSSSRVDVNEVNEIKKINDSFNYDGNVVPIMPTNPSFISGLSDLILENSEIEKIDEIVGEIGMNASTDASVTTPRNFVTNNNDNENATIILQQIEPLSSKTIVNTESSFYEMEKINNSQQALGISELNNLKKTSGVVPSSYKKQVDMKKTRKKIQNLMKNKLKLDDNNILLAMTTVPTTSMSKTTSSSSSTSTIPKFTTTTSREFPSLISSTISLLTDNDIEKIKNQSEISSTSSYLYDLHKPTIFTSTHPPLERPVNSKPTTKTQASTTSSSLTNNSSQMSTVSFVLGDVLIKNYTKGEITIDVGLLINKTEIIDVEISEVNEATAVITSLPQPITYSPLLQTTFQKSSIPVLASDDLFRVIDDDLIDSEGDDEGDIIDDDVISRNSDVLEMGGIEIGMVPAQSSSQNITTFLVNRELSDPVLINPNQINNSNNDNDEDEFIYPEVIDDKKISTKLNPKSADQNNMKTNIPSASSPPLHIQLPQIDRDSDTIFYISNTEVKVVEATPDSPKNLPPLQPHHSLTSQNTDQRYFPEIYEEDLLIDFKINKNLTDSEKYEEDIILSPLKTNFDPLKDLSVSYVGESYLDIEQSTNTQSPSQLSSLSLASQNQQMVASDVIIQPVVMPDIQTYSIGVPVIGELPPQIKLNANEDNIERQYIGMQADMPSHMGDNLVKNALSADLREEGFKKMENDDKKKIKTGVLTNGTTGEQGVNGTIPFGDDEIADGGE